MFHANGWCFTWAITAAAGTHVCLRKVNAANILVRHRQTWCRSFLCGADCPRRHREHTPVGTAAAAASCAVLTAGSPAPAAVLEAVGAMGFDVDHVFGITEIAGTPISCAWHDEWDTLPPEQQGKLQARQGVRAAAFENMSVADLATLEPVPADSTSCGEVLVRGNTVMMGYLKNADATAKAFAGGWFHTGDLAVVHPDGYIQITDRSKDVIISGGENISSVEVEEVIYRMSGRAQRGRGRSAG